MGQVACRNSRCFMSDVEQTPVHLKRGSCIEVSVFDDVVGAGCCGLIVGVVIYVIVGLTAVGLVKLVSPSLNILAGIMLVGGIIAGTVVFLWQPISGIQDMVKSESAMKYRCSVCKKTWYITESGTLREQ